MAHTIEVADLRKSFIVKSGGRKTVVEAVRGIAFQVRRGEIFGFLGPNGAGKTTTLRMLTTLLPIEAGKAAICGYDLVRQPGEVRRRIGYVSQLGGADLEATGRENLILAATLFAPLLGGIPMFGEAGVANMFVPGLLALFALGNGTGIGWIIIQEQKAGVIERFRVSPVSRFSLLMGNVLKDVVTFLLPAVIVIGVSAFFGFHIHAGGLVVLLILLCLLTAIVSAVCGSLGLILKDTGALAAVVTGAQLPIMLLAGVLLPISFGPAWLQVLAHVNPLYYVVEASRLLAAGTIWDGKVYLAFAVVIVLLALTLRWATSVYRKAVA